MSLKSEIYEQPMVLHRLIHDNVEQAEKIAKVIRKREVKYVYLAARGTSDNTGIYAKYLWGAYNGLPLAQATPSLFTHYQAAPTFDNALVLGISQSGQTPDVIRVLEEGKRQGALTLAITNHASSPLADVADEVFHINAGEEKAAVPTKSYTATLMALAMLSAALEGGRKGKARLDALVKVPKAMENVLRMDVAIEHHTERYRFMDQCVVLGRGFNYATAFEWAFKLKDLAHTMAQPYSSADFRYGPIAMVPHGFPVFAIVPSGKTFDDAMQLMDLLKTKYEAELIVISNDDRSLSKGQVALEMEPDIPEWASPLAMILPAQLFAYYLALAKKLDPNTPRRLEKVADTK